MHRDLLMPDGRNALECEAAKGEAERVDPVEGPSASDADGRAQEATRKRSPAGFQHAIQLLATVLFNGYVVGFAEGKIFTGASKAVCVPVLNCYSCPGALGACPIGALQNALISAGRSGFPFYVLGTIMLFGVVLGRLSCGLLCPFGFIQDLLHKIPVRKVLVPDWLDKPLRYLKYLVLVALVIALPALAAFGVVANSPFFCEYLCPAGTLEAGIPLLIADPVLRDLIGFLFDWKMLLLVAIVLLSVFISRPFCKYLCPLGAIYGLFNKFSLYKMGVDECLCTHCATCKAVCPMGVYFAEDTCSPECVRCGRCKRACPEGAISSGVSIESSVKASRQQEA